MNILVTGAAGFIGFHLARRLLADGHRVAGLDNLNDYYDPALKRARLDELAGQDRFDFHRLDITDRPALAALIADGGFDRVVHLAAQAGVRYSLENPDAYLQSNLVGFGHVIEACRQSGTPHLIYASSSSVYGASRDVPFREDGDADHPVSLYAATKRANELMAHSYAALHGLPATGLRFFTAYGPWGRPDMALFLFTRAILEGKPIQVFGHGLHKRDFTYIDDLIEGVVRVVEGSPPGGEPPSRIYNIGNGRAVLLNDFIDALEQALGMKAIRENLPQQPGDLDETWADCSALARDFGYRPETPVEEGIARFVAWYREYYRLGG